MMLSKNFSLLSFTKSSIAQRLGIDNTPDSATIERMKLLCEKVAQPARDALGRLDVGSGFRCLELNRELRSKDTSQHVKGEAVDLESPTLSNYDLACWIRDNLEFDQLILEFYSPKDPTAGWVHVSYSAEGNRNECLTVSKAGTRYGLG